MTRQIAASLLVFALVLASAAAPSWASYRCVDGVVRARCCCPDSEGAENQAATRSACCEITPNDPPLSPQAVAAHDEPLVATPVAAPLPELLIPPEPASPPRDVRLTDDLGPPIFLATRSLLI